MSSRTIRGAVLERTGAERPYARSRPLTVTELQLDGPGPGEVLVRIEAAGVCHSDLSVVNGSRIRPLPMLLGHEAAGRIEELGPDVPGLAVGQRVVMAFLPRCGECAACRTNGKMPCTPGSAANNAGTLLGGGIRLARNGEPVLHHLGVSAFATHSVVNYRSLVAVEDDVPPAVAALLGCAVLTGGGAVMNAVRPGPEDDVAVVGLGGVGMAALLAARAAGVRRVIGVDALPEKLKRALELGADAVYSPEEAAAEGIRAALTVEAAGHPRAFETAVTSRPRAAPQSRLGSLPRTSSPK